VWNFLSLRETVDFHMPIRLGQIQAASALCAQGLH
jgi:hypothetical protein